MEKTSLTERYPSQTEREAAENAVSMIARALQKHKTFLPVSFQVEDTVAALELPASVGHLLLDVLSHVAKGEMIHLVPYGSDLTTQEAADLLKVSRPFLVKLLDRGAMPFHRVGKHRRVRSEDLFAYMERRDGARSSALKKLQSLGQEFDAQ